MGIITGLTLTGYIYLNQFEDYMVRKYPCYEFCGILVQRPTKKVWKRLKRQYLIPRRIIKDVETHAAEYGVEIK